MKISLASLGCSKNKVDAEKMLGGVVSSGFTFTYDFSDADVIIVNTCAFIEDARKESINEILELAEYKKTGKCKLLIATGCLSQRYGKELENEFPEVDAFVPLSGGKKIYRLINRLLGLKTFGKHSNKRFRIDSPFSAYLKISDGCNNRCSYCAIPLIRGKYRSNSPSRIIDEAKALEASGVKELVLIGQDTTMYGYRDKISGLPRLVEEILKETDFPWIRIMYMHPAHLSDNIIDLISTEKRVCSYVDIPVQHISDRILKSMNRRITSKEIMLLIDKLRARISDVTLRTTLIVGYPGETQEEFNQLLDFVNYAKFERLGGFLYSKEEDTKAFKLNDNINQNIARKRLDKIMQVQEGININNNNNMLNKTINVLIEGVVDKNGEQYYIGRSQRDAPDVDGLVFLKKDKELDLGAFVNTKINSCDKYDLFGEVV